LYVHANVSEKHTVSIFRAMPDGGEVWHLGIDSKGLIFGPKTNEVTGEWRKLHNEELYILYSFPNIIRQIKSRRMRWAGHVARMGEERKVYRV
jgi:hypothetical protein